MVLALMTAVLSAFLDNLTAILLVVPISLELSRLLQVPVVPLVLVQVMASNIGGTATMIGDPPNIMIGSHVDELSFVDFIVHLGPVSVVALLVTSSLLYICFRRSLTMPGDVRDRLSRLDPSAELKKERLVPILAVLVRHGCRLLLARGPAYRAGRRGDDGRDGDAAGCRP